MHKWQDAVTDLLQVIVLRIDHQGSKAVDVLGKMFRRKLGNNAKMPYMHIIIFHHCNEYKYPFGMQISSLQMQIQKSKNDQV